MTIAQYRRKTAYPRDTATLTKEFTFIYGAPAVENRHKKDTFLRVT